MRACISFGDFETFLRLTGETKSRVKVAFAIFNAISLFAIFFVGGFFCLFVCRFVVVIVSFVYG